MAAFSAEEDKALLLLVVPFDKDGVTDWRSIRYHMSPTSKSIEELQARLEYLKHVDTSLLDDLPAGYVSGSCLQRPEARIYQAISAIFGHITKADINQPSGRPHLNVGEMAPIGVSALIEKLALTPDDRFADIGSGSGTVLAQVVLQSQVQKAIGLEIRPEVAQKSRDAIKAAQDMYPLLQRVEVVTGDVKRLSDDTAKRFKDVTVIFCNNLAFQPEDLFGLHEFICTYRIYDALRFILLTQQLCARCPAQCKKEFCTVWREEEIIWTQTCWTNGPVPVYMYSRKVVRADDDTLLGMVQQL